MGEREDQIIERAKKSVAEEGFTEVNISNRCSIGPGDFRSYFDLMVDRKLAGLPGEPSSRLLWTEMKYQINHLRQIIADAEKEYTRLFNAHQGLKEMYDDLLKGK